MMDRTRVAPGVIAVALVSSIVATTAAVAYPRPGVTTRESMTADGKQLEFSPIPFGCRTGISGELSGGHGCSSSLTPDGRFLSFSTAATNVVANDVNQVADVFTLDRRSGEVEVDSVPASGQTLAFAGSAAPGGGSFWPQISANGSFVVFVSTAINLVAGDTNLRTDVFVHDRSTGAMERVSVGQNGAEGNGQSGGFYTGPAISADGRFVVFDSSATNLIANDTNGSRDIFVHDRRKRLTTRVSVSSEGEEATGEAPDSLSPSISADGRWVSFTSYASNLVPGDDNGVNDVFVHDLKTGKTELASSPTGPTDPGNLSISGGTFSTAQALSADGRYVVMYGMHSGLVPSDGNNNWDVFVRDRRTEETERVSVDSSGRETEDDHLYPSISAGGRFIVFQRDRQTEGVAQWQGDVVLHDRQTGVTETLGLIYTTEEWCGDQLGASDHQQASVSSFGVGSNGKHVTWDSCSAQVVEGDTNGGWDIFMRDRGIAQGVDIRRGTSTYEPPPSLLCVPGVVCPSQKGADLIRARVVARPPLRDIYVQADLAGMPVGTSDAGDIDGQSAAIVYGFDFVSNGARFQVRAEQVVEGAGAAGGAALTLFREDAITGSWVRAASLEGGLGTTGNTITFAVPFDTIGYGRPRDLSEISAFAAVGTASAGELEMLDAIELE